MNLKLQHFVSKPALVLADQVLYSGSSFLLTFYLARKLSISDFGIYAGVVLVGYLLMSICNAITIQPFQVLFPKTNQVLQYQTTTSIGMLLLLLLLAVLGQGIGLLYSHFYQQLPALEAFVVFLMFFLLHDYFRKFFLALDKAKWTLLADTLLSITLITVFYLNTNSIDLATNIYILALGFGIGSLGGVYYLIKNFQFSSNWKEFANWHYIEGKWLLLVAGLQWCSSNFFVFLSGIYIGIEALGALRLVQSFFGVINVFLQTVENYIVPRVAFLYKDSQEQSKKYLLKVTTIGGLIFALVLTLFIIFDQQIIKIAGGVKYMNYAYLIQIMAVLYVFIFLGYPYRIMVRVMVLNKIFFLGYLISFGFSVLSFHYLLKNFQLNGAIFGLIFNQMIMIGYWHFQLKKNNFQLWN